MSDSQKVPPQFHFIAGLPRAGSTLLAALLNQNPAFHASGTSAAQIIFSQLYSQFSGQSEMSALMNDDQRRDVLRAVLEAMHAGRGPAQVVFDTNRKWLQRIDQLVALYPLCRFILCVRDPAEVVGSLEKARRGLSFRQSRLFEPDQTLPQRIDAMMAPDGLVGGALALVQDALRGPYSERIIVIDHARLLTDTEAVLATLYDFLRQPLHTHDLQNFSFEMPALDAFLNTPGLHSVSGPIRPPQHDGILPPDLAEPLSKRAVWKTLNHSAATLMI